MRLPPSLHRMLTHRHLIVPAQKVGGVFTQGTRFHPYVCARDVIRGTILRRDTRKGVQSQIGIDRHAHILAAPALHLPPHLGV